MPDDFNRTLPPQYDELLAIWDRMARRLMRFYCGCGAGSIACSLLVSAYAGYWAESYTRFFAFLGSLLLALIASFNAGTKANAARAAWRLFNAACIRYRYDAKFSIEELNEKYVLAESLIGDMNFTGATIPPKR